MSLPLVVCLTPVRNEAWILERFLAAALTWADLVVIADQGSTDGSREIAARFERVHVVVNIEQRYDELARQRLLLREGRQLAAGRPVGFFALDADEALAADLPTADAWRAALRAPPGTAIDLRWANVLPGGDRAWVPPHTIQFGFIDDGSEHDGSPIHSRRLPRPLAVPTVTIDDSVVLHLQYLDWERMVSKQRFYQCWERVHSPHKRAAQIFRQYHYFSVIPMARVRATQPEWLRGYIGNGVDLLETNPSPAYDTDARVLDLVQQHGVGPFRKVDIWSVDWTSRARALGRVLPRGLEGDPRRPDERLAMRWLASTQVAAHRPAIRATQVALRVLGW